jgi:putative endonuclease
MTTANKNLDLGNLGENIVADCLKKDGFKILIQNYKTRRGEIDIIVTKDELLCFVEVKTRNNNEVSMYEIVTYTKQKRIIKAALDFLRHHRQYLQYVCRFDVALYNLQTKQISIIPNAFYAEI